jgi:hypothetical protein
MRHNSASRSDENKGVWSEWWSLKQISSSILGRIARTPIAVLRQKAPTWKLTVELENLQVECFATKFHFPWLDLTHFAVAAIKG